MIKHIIRLFLLLLTLCTAAHAQVVDIPDPNLQAAIRGELQLLPGSRITREDMLRLESLGAARHDIMHLTGLEHATNLTSLYLWGNPLAELTPIANLERLTYLDIAACSISDITSAILILELRPYGAKSVLSCFSMKSINRFAKNVHLRVNSYKIK